MSQILAVCVLSPIVPPCPCRKTLEHTPAELANALQVLLKSCLPGNIEMQEPTILWLWPSSLISLPSPFRRNPTVSQRNCWGFLLMGCSRPWCFCVFCFLSQTSPKSICLMDGEGTAFISSRKPALVTLPTSFPVAESPGFSSRPKAGHKSSLLLYCT